MTGKRSIFLFYILFVLLFPILFCLLRASAPDDESVSLPRSALLRSAPDEAQQLARLLNHTPFPEGLPAETTLLYLDFSRFPVGYFSTRRKSLSTIEKYMSPNLLQDTQDLYFSKDGSTPAAEYKKWILHREETIEAEDPPYHVLRLFSKQQNIGLEALMELVSAGVDLGRPFRHVATIIVFPLDAQRAMVYGFGMWPALINQRAIVPGWGLQLAASRQLCNPQRIKILKATNYTREVPATLKITSLELTSIDALGLEVGSEGLDTLSTRPPKAKCFKGTVIASDYFHFSFHTDSPDDVSSTPFDTSVFAHMRALALGLERYAASSVFAIHPRLLVFVDEEEKDDKVIERLNRELVTVMKKRKTEDDEDGLSYIFVSPYVRRMFDRKEMYFHVSGRRLRKKASFREAIAARRQYKDFSLDTRLRLNIDKRTYDEAIRFLITSLPIPFGDEDERYFRFDRGRWLRVDASRFEKIKILLRQSKMSASELNLPEYTYTHALTQKRAKNGRMVSDGEKTYLRDCLRRLGDSASFLDCTNVRLGSSKDTFEFGDLLIEKGGQLYIVHAKRAKAGALSHHREQVERASHYLATNLRKEGSQGYFVDTAVGDFYLSVELPATEKVLNERQKKLPEIHLEEGVSLQDSVLKNEGSHPARRREQQLWDLNAFLRSIDLTYFEDNQQDFVRVFMTLRDWVVTQSIDLSLEANTNKIQALLAKVERASKLQKMLFRKGPLIKRLRRNVTFVLAVIDDRQIEAVKKAGKKLSKSKQEEAQAKAGIIYTKSEPLFRPQDLWGLDMTRTTVQGKGFGFKVLVVNEHQTREWDAFGTKSATGSGKLAFAEEESDTDTTDTSDDESEPRAAPSRRAPRGESASVYSWKENDTTTVTFTEHHVSGRGGNCAFHATGTTRRAAIDALKARTNDEEIRRLIWDDMQSANPTLIGGALPAKEGVDAFLEKEFIDDNQYMSYIRSVGDGAPSGTFVALARAQGFGLRIFTAGEGRTLTSVCIVPKPNGAAPEYFLLHTGYQDSPGRHVLNHFNLLVQSADHDAEVADDVPVARPVKTKSTRALKQTTLKSLVVSAAGEGGSQ